MDRLQLANGYAQMKKGTVLAKYLQQNPGEVQKLDAFVAAIKNGDNPTPPTLGSDFGEGLVNIIASGLDAVTPPPPSAPESPDNTVIKAPSTSSIVDASGNKWSITSAGKVAVNGTADAITSSVVELAYESKKIWQKNSNGLWWSKSKPSDTWAPTAGTSTSPVPGDTPPPQPSGNKHWGISPATAYVPDIVTQMSDFAALGAMCPRLNSSDTAAQAALSKGVTSWVVWTDPNFTPAQAVAYCQKYPKCIGIEIGNELNLGWAWTLDQTANMQKAFWAAMKAAGLEAKVMLPSVGNGLSAVGGLSMLDWCKGLASRGIKYGQAFTIANYHNYGGDPVSADNWQHCWTPNSAGESCQSVLGNPPFMVTEFGAKIGWSGVADAAAQAKAATAWIAHLASRPNCIGGQWFLDYDGSSWSGFGLRDTSNAQRPSWAAYQSAIKTYALAGTHRLTADHLELLDGSGPRPSDKDMEEFQKAKAEALREHANSNTTV